MSHDVQAAITLLLMHGGPITEREMHEVFITNGVRVSAAFLMMYGYINKAGAKKVYVAQWGYSEHTLYALTEKGKAVLREE